MMRQNNVHYSRFHGNQEQENVPPPAAGEHFPELVRKPLYEGTYSFQKINIASVLNREETP